MRHVLTDIVPLALGIAITPLAVLAILLILLSHGGLRTATAFLVGWTLTLTAVIGGIAISGIGRGGVHGRGVDIAEVVIGSALIVVAAIEWRRRPRAGTLEAPPAWMARLDALAPGRAMALGALLALNPKDLALTVAAGAKLGGAGLSAAQAGVVVAVFVVIATLGVAVPIILRAVMGERATPPLARARDEIERRGRVLGAIVVGIIGLVVLAQGVRGLF